ncbi:CDC27 protein [Cladophialophora chaetospira]|uniref:DNA polymerase delta subunit 3 n=1 Tax=Cladophialophora chaetospira TaxID=386627 RepID=A0AA38XHH2_9EURO|nr:CDC27 protein [Cladophialophora chaetospira]
MAQDFKKYLATEILSEQRTISYRNVARALKVHVNAAKCMLYEFHEFQNGKKPGSIYATYLLSGTKKRSTLANTKNGVNGHHRDYDEDEHIPSSPPPFTSSMLEPSQQSSQAEEDEVAQAPVRTITLVREETLQEMKAQYETITSIHIYSLSPTRIQDLVTLTDVGRGLFTDVFMKEDPLQHNKTYGVIQNPDVRRRKGKRPVIPSGPAPKFQAVKEEVKKASTTQSKAAPAAPAAKTEEPSRPSSRDSTSTSTSTKPTTKQPTLKRDSSDLFKAFAKQGQKKATPTSTPKPSTPTDEDKVMKDDDEGESEDEALFLDSNTRKPATSKKRPSDATKEKEERAAKLRKLFPEDEEEAAVPNVEKASGLDRDDPVTAKKGTDADVPSQDPEGDVDADQVAWSDSDGEAKKSTTRQQQAEAGPKRRRGKRKVMKKRTMKDEDGYLVTKEEAVWESFSEDEPEPVPARKELPKSSFGAPKSQSQSQIQPKAGAKKKGAGGGGNIMSFFGKKNA